MTRYLHYILSISLVLLISFSSCKKTKTDTDSAKPLFTVNFTDNFIGEQLTAFVLISDSHGKFLGDTICNYNGEYPVFPETNTPITSKITITIGNYEIFMHLLVIHLNTYTNVSPYGEWNVKGNQPDTVGHAIISLTHLPVLNGPILFSNSGYSNMTFDTSNQVQPLFLSPDELYIKLKTPAGEKFKQTSGITLSKTYSVDMSDAVTPSYQTISLPMSSQDYEITLSGYHGTNYASPLLVVTDHILSDGTAINAANIAYPPSTFTGFLTDMMIRESYTSDLQWFYHVAGDIPSQFKKIDAAVNSVNALNGSASLNLTGTFKMTEVNWQFVDFAHTLFDWHIFGPDTTKTLTLPVLSEGLAKLFPTLAADSLTCMSVEISNYPNLSNYQEILKMKFDPTRSKLPGDFEVNSVKKILSGKK